MNILDISELRLMDDYRAQTEVLARIDRWLITLLDAGITYTEANAILADIAGEPEETREAA